MRPHISINVSNVPKSVAFYQRVFGVAPQKQNSTYAKFDLREPQLNLAMQSGGRELSRVNHFGIELGSAEEVSAWESRLVEAGVLELKEKNVECCFARSDKVWFRDPDGNSWEVFFVLEQLPIHEPKAKIKVAKGMCGPDSGCC